MLPPVVLRLSAARRTDINVAQRMRILSSPAPPNFHAGSRLTRNDAAIRGYDAAGKVIETHEHKGFESAPRFPWSATALDVARHVLYVFLPKTHRAAVFADA